MEPYCKVLPLLFLLKGSSDAKFTFACCFGGVCTHPSYNDKIHPVLFLDPHKSHPFLRSSHSWQSDVTQTQAPPTTVDWHWCFTLDPPWLNRKQSAIVSTPCRQECLISVWGAGCNNEHSSCHLLPTYEPLKTQRFVFEGNASSDLPKCVCVCANHSWSSLIYRRSEYKFSWIFANRLS